MQMHFRLALSAARQQIDRHVRSQDGGLTPEPDSLTYISEADRFVTGTAQINKAERDQEIAKRDQQTYQKR